MKTLPALTSLPTRHPQSCASLSLPLLTLLNSILPRPPALTLSIGSGPGLLEAAFLQQYPERGAAPTSFYGVEVVTAPASPPVNRFLPEQNSLVVSGTWAVAGEAEEAEGLVFVYPRQSGLVARYLGVGKMVTVVVWIGPRCEEESGRKGWMTASGKSVAFFLP
ncbi:hypothetical protein B0T14DRAFT_224628 [Immersiella caudata]|uniref:Uncharacterized protein n=1 Tax=Immersiella caudata TaxID=314043 RepID=A0AA39WR99_9PEZI|nr:hypothetical protein B0T14DRAFT_224628 [Immersiella caudata]